MIGTGSRTWLEGKDQPGAQVQQALVGSRWYWQNSPRIASEPWGTGLGRCTSPQYQVQSVGRKAPKAFLVRFENGEAMSAGLEAISPPDGTNQRHGSVSRTKGLGALSSDLPPQKFWVPRLEWGAYNRVRPQW